MTSESEPSTSKWLDLEAYGGLRELAESHQAALLRNISQRRAKKSERTSNEIERTANESERTANESGSPEQSKKKVKRDRPLPSSPTVSEQVLEPEREPDPEPAPSQPAPSQPAPKKVVGQGRKGGINSTYTFNRDKLPQLVARAKEFVKKWHEPKLPKTSLEEIKRKLRESCHVHTINHSKAERDCIKPTNPLYISMELRKSLIRHDWAGVKKLLKVLLRCPIKEDHITWKLVLTTLYYYPGAEAVLREFIERNRMTFGSSEIRRGLLEINGMAPYSQRRTSKWEREDTLAAVGDADGKKRKKKGEEEVDVLEVLVSDSGDDTE